MQAELQYHNFPPMVLGAGGSGLPHKFHAILFAIFLEAGTTQASLAKFCREICAATSDLCTEFSLTKVVPLPVGSVLPWMRLDETYDPFAVRESDDFETGEPQAVNVSFSSGLAYPGLLHVIHNAASEVLTVTGVLDSQVEALAKVCALLSDKQSCDRLKERCFASPVGQQFHKKLEEFSCRVYRPRWGSIAFCCRAVLDIKPILLFGWSLDRYTGMTLTPGVELQLANSAITSPYWWASMQVLDALYQLVRDCFGWAEGCPCHYSLDWNNFDVEVRKLWQSCPLRGLRVPEVCAGEFFKMFEQLQNQATVHLATSLPESLSAIERGRLLLDFERGRAHLFYTFTLKLTAFTMPPLLLGAAGHYSTIVAQSALRQCMVSSSQHPKILQLQSEPLVSQAREYLNGGELDDLPDLAVFVAGLRFAHAVERRIEGGHARVLRRGRVATKHAESFDSLALRTKEINFQLEHDVEFFGDLANFLDQGRSPKKLVGVLGLSEHPAIPHEKHPWHKIYRQIVYRADKFTLYQSAPPEIEIQQVRLQQPVPLAIADAAAPAGQAAMVAAGGELKGFEKKIRDAALVHYQSTVKSKENSETPQIYSCKMFPLSAVQSLNDSLVRHSGDGSVNQSLPDWLSADGTLWFSVVATTPAQSKLANHGGLRLTDSAISVHKCLQADDLEAIVLSTPVNLSSSLACNIPVEKTSLLLTTHLFSLECLREASAWEVLPESCYVLDVAGNFAFNEQDSFLLGELVSKPSGFQTSARGSLERLAELQAHEGIIAIFVFPCNNIL